MAFLEKENGSVPVSECPLFLVRIVYTGCVLLDLSWNMSLRRSTKVDGETNRKIRFRNGMCLKRKNVERKNDCPISIRS